MKVVTFYADAQLPTGPAEKSRGFDWHGAIENLSHSVYQSLRCWTHLVTDNQTAVTVPPWLRVGNAKAEGIMLWLLDAQASAIAAAVEPVVLVSPDTLIAGPLDALFGDWDVCLLTRARPKPIVNSVISVVPGVKVARLWNRMAVDARALPAAAREWGADIDIIVDTLQIQPSEDGIREVDGVRVRLMPMESVFQSVDSGPVRRLPVPIWDFKGRRKRLMLDYKALLQ